MTKLSSEVLSIDSDDDDDNYQVFTEYLNDNTLRTKHKMVSDVEKIGESLLLEIDKKKRFQNKKKLKHIKYITKHSNKYDFEELKSYEINDVLKILEEVREESQSVFKKFLLFIFNL